MYAVIETGGKQYRVSQGDVVRVERLEENVGEQVAIDAVHLIADGENVFVLPGPGVGELQIKRERIDEVMGNLHERLASPEFEGRMLEFRSNTEELEERIRELEKRLEELAKELEKIED